MNRKVIIISIVILVLVFSITLGAFFGKREQPSPEVSTPTPIEQHSNEQNASFTGDSDFVEYDDQYLEARAFWVRDAQEEEMLEYSENAIIEE